MDSYDLAQIPTENSPANLNPLYTKRAGTQPNVKIKALNTV